MCDTQDSNGCTLARVRAAKPEAKGTFARLGKVVGVGITRVGGGYGLKVNLQSAPGEMASWPKEIRGVPVRVEVVGPIKKRVK